jgi:hypothetical protein
MPRSTPAPVKTSKRDLEPPVDVYAALRPLFGLHGQDGRVGAFLAPYRGKLPNLEPGAGFASVDLRTLGVRLLFWVGWGNPGIAGTYAAQPGTLVEASFFQQGIDRHKEFTGALPLGLRVDMTREELEATLGKPTSTCQCGQEPVCFVSWHLAKFDGELAADITHHAKHAGKVRPRAGRVDITVHVPRAKK